VPADIPRRLGIGRASVYRVLGKKETEYPCLSGLAATALCHPLARAEQPRAQRRGGTADGALLDGPILWRRTRFRRVVLTAAHLDSDPTIGRTTWRSAGSLTGGGWQPAIFSSVRIRH
jgi:hypothetical protein